MINLLTDTVLIITGFLLILLSVVVLLLSKGSRLNRYLLAGFLLTKAFLIVRWSVFRFEIVYYEDNPYFYLVSAACFFLLAPLLYLYIKSLCFKEFKIKLSGILHAVPFLLIALLSIFIISIENSPVETTPSINYISDNYWRIFWTLNFLQILIYIIAMFYIVRIYHRKIREIYSTINKIKLNWLRGLLILMMLHWVFVVSRGIITIFSIKTNNLTGLIDLFSISIFLVFVTILVLKGLAHISIFNGIEERSNNNPKLSDAETDKLFERIKNYMEQKKPYLSPSLSIDNLSEQLSVPVWQISFTINNSANQNFFNFINSYRVKESQKMLADTSKKRENILQILYEVGFNSKSTFNSVFKKFTGITPTEYRLRHQI